MSAIVLALMMSACGAVSGSRDIAENWEMAKARRQLDAHMADCTERYGYSPEAAAATLGPHVLGAGEREWRGCVYEAIEKYLLPRAPNPELYRRAITEDRELTEAVAGGTITRKQREDRIRSMLEEIERSEEANRAKLEAQTLNRLEMEMRQDMMRRSLSPLLR